MTTKQFYKPLLEFLLSPSDFKILYSTCQLVGPTTQRICVLDSSFNPPHLGHYALIKEALKHDYGVEQNENNPTSRVILLLLSVNNADKSLVGPEEYSKRIDMMYLMARDLELKLPAKVSIGVTKHARFVDKSMAILKKLHELSANKIKLTFLVGFDTLIRIFNPKYYLPDKLSHSLEEFMTLTDLFCLPRNDETISLKLQSTYAHDIRCGKFPEIPNHWSASIHFVKDFETFESSIGHISSSSVRNKIERGDNDWEDKVIPEVREYIEKEEIYT